MELNMIIWMMCQLQVKQKFKNENNNDYGNIDDTIKRKLKESEEMNYHC